MIFNSGSGLIRQTLLVVALLVTGCGGTDAVAPDPADKVAFDDFREVIVDVVQDSERQAQILSLIDVYQSDFSNLQAAVRMQRTELRRLNADYDASREQFQSYFDKYNAEIRTARKKAMESRAAFVRSTTADEWNALNKADTKTMKQLVSSIQGI